jgi:hypothetical protein
MQKTVGWFSGGGSSAVAIKLMINEIDELYYIHIDDQHSDTLRFVDDCAKWFGKPVKILQSPLKTVEAACYAAGGRGYINGPSGAACTRQLKRLVRQQWEYEQPIDTRLRYVWGMDSDEVDRLDHPERGLRAKMPDKEHVCPLIDTEMQKTDAHKVMKASGIKRPAMYDLGYLNNNCVGCVKGGMSYFNRVRITHPEVFAKRAAMERIIGATCLKESDGTRLYLDELNPKRGRNEKPIVEDCGIMCELMAI